MPAADRVAPLLRPPRCAHVGIVFSGPAGPSHGADAASTSCPRCGATWLLQPHAKRNGDIEHRWDYVGVRRRGAA